MAGAPDRFRLMIARQLRSAIRLHNLTEQEAATELGVSRVMLSRYLNRRATPGADVLWAACRKWKISFNFSGYIFSESAFRPAEAERPPSEAVQLALFEDPQVLPSGNVLVKIGTNRSEAPELTVEIRFAS